MKSLLLYLVQVIIASGIMYGYYHLFLRNRKFHQYNRFYLLSIVFISILVPFLQIPVYFSEETAVPDAVIKTWQTIASVPGTGNEAVTDLANTTIAPTLTSENILYAIYFLIASIIFIRLIVSLLRIIRLKRMNPYENMDGIKLVSTSDDAAPFSFFRWMFWHRRIEIDSYDGQQIFRHELFHIQQRHSMDIIFMEIVRMLFWVNPFFHLIRHELRTIHEFLADKFATTEDTKWEYSELLLMQVLNTRYHLVNPFFHNQIKRRIAMITKPQKTSYQYLRKLLVLPVSVIVIILFAFRLKEKEQLPGINLIPDPALIQAKPNYEEIEKQLQAEISEFQSAPVKLKSIIEKSSDTSKSFFKEHWGFEITVDEVVVENPGYNSTTKDKVPDLIIFNGEEYTNRDFQSKMKLVKSIKAKRLHAIPPGNANAIETYGERARNGVIEIEDATIQMKINSGEINIRPGSTGEEPLIVLDGKIVPGGMNSIKSIDPSLIESINVLKGETATQLYGEKGKSGVIVINLKQEVKLEVKTDKKLDDNHLQLSATTTRIETKTENQLQVVDEQIVVFEKMEIDPDYPGGSSAWQEYLKKNLDKSIASKNGAPKGSYTVFVQFVVHTDGHISDIKPLTKHGFGMEREAIRVIKNVSKWSPGIQNGHQVNGIKKIRIDFTGSDKTSLQNFLLPEIVAVGYISGTVSPEKLKEKINTPQAGIRIGSVEWKKFFERNLNSYIPMSEGWKPGNFQVIVQFTRNANGSISNIKALNYRGSKTADHCIELLKSFQSTLAPEMNSQSNIYQQPITFSLIEDKKVVRVDDRKLELPVISKNESLDISPYKLIHPPAGVTITAFRFGAEDLAGNYHECIVDGDRFNSSALNMIANAPVGSVLFVESISAVQNGVPLKLPSRVYKLI